MPTGFEVAGVALAIPGVVDLCIKYGSFLKEKYHLYKGMGDDIKLYDLVCNLVSGEMHDILIFFKAIETKLSDDLQVQIIGMLSQLGTELQALDSLVSGNESPGHLERLAYSFHTSKKIRKKCASLEEWHVRFLRRATVLLLFGGFSSDLANKSTEEAAARAVDRIKRIQLAVVGPNPGDMYKGKLPDDVKFGDSISSAATLTGLGDSLSLAEFKNYERSNDVEKKNNARHVVLELATKLANVDSRTMGILRSIDF